MPKILGKFKQIMPVFAIHFCLMSSLEAIALPAVKTHNFNRQDKSPPYVLQRQEIFGNSFLLQTTPIKYFLSQINSVQELQDVKPTDWSYDALQVLIERYGCISGFPDQSFRGEQTISRAEFVAGLNACLNTIEAIIANSDRIPQTDIDTIIRLSQEFQSDLAILQGRTDGSQARLEDLEATQFSTTSKLQGEVIFGLGSVLSSKSESNTVLGSRLRLELETSFSGQDLLFTRLSRSDFSGFSEELGTLQGNLAFAEPENNDLQLEVLQYIFNVGSKVDFIVGATGTTADDIAETISVLDGEGGSGSISLFGTRNPIYYPPGDAGLGIIHRPVDQIKISAGYLASNANESSLGSGLFDGPYSALGQITISPRENFSLAATYIHSYNQSDLETGTNRANLQSLTAELFDEEVSTVSNSYGLEMSWAISDRIVLGGWGGLSKVSNLSTLNQQIDRGTQDIWNWAATLALPDLGKEGSLGGIVVGMEPTVTNSTINTENLDEDSDRSLHLEAFYQYQVNDNIAVTPGVVWITKPDSDPQNSDDLVIGTIRTTFSF
ncbi:iron uptake porin [Pleurocapsa sp. PCC 7319]|uniref:iron uptake porin n=1 Tax=Pleurocapsa sp. PCC 7319 TaxID=118161 RepID=UPI00034593A3|nr:iron uptake porin [Pleurocapsa sp. PCC 7319]